MQIFTPPQWLGALYLILVSLYVAGIIFIGSQALLYVELEVSFRLAIISGIVYVCGMIIVSGISNRFRDKADSGVRSRKEAFLFGTIGSVLVFPYSVFLNFVSIGELASPKYYFYSTIMAIIVFFITAIYKGVFQPLPTLKKKVLKAQFTLQLEILKGTLTGIILVLLGTAYSQVLTGIEIGSSEMILVFFTTVGVIAFVLAPLLKSLLDLMDRL